MTRGILIGVLAMAAVVVASNILVQFLFGNWLTWGAFTYPIAFLVTDIMNRVYGVSAARKVVLAGFIVGIGCSFVGTQIMGEFGPLVTLRIALGSGIAFLVAQLVDVFIFNRLRSGAWWRAPLASTLIGSSLDTAIFFTLAFSASFVFLEPMNENTKYSGKCKKFFAFSTTRGTILVWDDLSYDETTEKEVPMIIEKPEQLAKESREVSV